MKPMIIVLTHCYLKCIIQNTIQDIKSEWTIKLMNICLTMIYPILPSHENVIHCSMTVEPSSKSMLAAIFQVIKNSVLK